MIAREGGFNEGDREVISLLIVNQSHQTALVPSGVQSV